MNAASVLPLLAEGGHGHESLNPIAIGGGVFLLLCFLLFVVSRFNRDR